MLLNRFLWAFLSIEDMCSGTSDNRIRQALQEIPTHLTETFDRALGRIMKKGNQNIAKKTFAWVEVALQPLTLPQLQEALSLRVGQRTFCQDDLISDIGCLPVWCEGFVEVDEADNTVRFSHQTVREFLLTAGSGEFSALHIQTSKCHQLAGETCITYVSLDNFQTTSEDERSLNVKPFAIAPNNGEPSTQTPQTPGKDGLSSRWSRLLLPGPKHSETVSPTNTMAPYLSNRQPTIRDTATQSPFYEYANVNWFNHRIQFDRAGNEATWKLLGNLLRGNITYSRSVPWRDQEWKNKLRDCYFNKFPFPPALLQFLHDYEPWFIYLYAHYSGNQGLSCRAFMLVSEDTLKDRRLRELLHTLTAWKNHKACANRCLSSVLPQLDHALFMDKVAQSIARGMSYFPAFIDFAEKKECGCANQPKYTLQEDICNVLSEGYCPEDHPYLQVLLSLAENVRYKNTTITAVSWGEAYRISMRELFEARTRCSRSIFDILVEVALRYPPGSFRDLNKHLPRFFENYRSKLGAAYSWEARTQLTLSLLQNLGMSLEMRDAGQKANKEDMRKLKDCIHQLSNYGGIVPLHRTTIQRTFLYLIIPVLRTRQDFAPLVELFFGRSVRPGLEYVHEELFRQSVWHNNWDLAACLLRLQRTPVDVLDHSGMFSYVRKALRCEACHSEFSQGTKVFTVNGVPHNPFYLCSEHWSIICERTDGGNLNAETHSIKCLGSPTASLPTQADDLFLRRGLYR